MECKEALWRAAISSLKTLVTKGIQLLDCALGIPCTEVSVVQVTLYQLQL